MSLALLHLFSQALSKRNLFSFNSNTLWYLPLLKDLPPTCNLFSFNNNTLRYLPLLEDLPSTLSKALHYYLPLLKGLPPTLNISKDPPCCLPPLNFSKAPLCYLPLLKDLLPTLNVSKDPPCYLPPLDFFKDYLPPLNLSKDIPCYMLPPNFSKDTPHLLSLLEWPYERKPLIFHPQWLKCYSIILLFKVYIIHPYRISLLRFQVPVQRNSSTISSLPILLVRLPTILLKQWYGVAVVVAAVVACKHPLQVHSSVFRILEHMLCRVAATLKPPTIIGIFKNMWVVTSSTRVIELSPIGTMILLYQVAPIRMLCNSQTIKVFSLMLYRIAAHNSNSMVWYQAVTIHRFLAAPLGLFLASTYSIKLHSIIYILPLLTLQVQSTNQTKELEKENNYLQHP